MSPRAWLAVAVAVAVTVAGVGCTRVAEVAPRARDGVVYGVTSVPFRGRWWHYYERGVSFAAGGFLAEAEADLRACLRLRQNDARRARTYGFHFVQCFAHRELGAVLLEQGRLDQAEAELEASLAQEPSAKARALLDRIARARAAQAAIDGPAPDPVPARAALPPARLTVITPLAPEPFDSVLDDLGLDVDLDDSDDPLAGWQGGVLTIDEAVPAPPAGDQGEAAVALALSGHLPGDGALWIRPPAGAGAPRPVERSADGRFTITLLETEVLAAGPAVGDQGDELVTVLAPADDLDRQPSLTLDGPGDGDPVVGERVYYRYRAAAAELHRLVVSGPAGDQRLAIDLAGVLAAGTLAVPVTVGTERLTFTLHAADGTTAVASRAPVVRPDPVQDRALRAPALVVPLGRPRDGAGGRDWDDPMLLGAMVADGRFRVLDAQADAILERELALVEAGHVDRATAAAAGRRLQARYVLAGTLRRGPGEIECFLRLIQAGTARVVAIADAYMPSAGAADDDRFYSLLAGRLRQVFPILDGVLGSDGEALRLALGARHGVDRERTFYVIERGADLLDPATGEVLLAGPREVVGRLRAIRVDEDRSQLELADGRAAAGAVVVSE